MKKLLLFAVAATCVAILFAGCTSPDTSDPKAYYQSLVLKSTQIKQYRIVYDLTVEMGLSFKAKMAVSKLDDSQKIVTEANFLGQSVAATVYNISGKVITCSKGSSMFGVTGEQEVKCTAGKGTSTGTLPDFTQFVDQINNNTVFAYNGKSQMIGRECERFSITVSNVSSAFSSLLRREGPSKDSSQLKIVSCIDTKTGISLAMNISVSQYSEIEGKTVDTPFMSVIASSISESVPAGEFDLPVSFTVDSLYCIKDKVYAVVSAFKPYSGPLSFTYEQSSYESGFDSTAQQTIQTSGTFATDKRTLVQITLPKDGTYFSNAKLCKDTDCQSAGYCSTIKSDTCLTNTGGQQSCEAAGCMYEDSICKPVSCFGVQKQADCEKYKTCSWSMLGSTGFCSEKTCYSMKNESACLNSGLTCDWDADYKSCSTPSCYSKKTESACQGLSGCSWYKDSSSPYCATDYSAMSLE